VPGDVGGQIQCEDGQARPVKRAAFGGATSGDNTLVAAVAGRRIRVVSFFGLATGAVAVYFTSGAGGAVIWGDATNKIALAANGGFVLPRNTDGWFQTAPGAALVVNLSGAVAFSGGVTYLEF